MGDSTFLEFRVLFSGVLVLSAIVLGVNDTIYSSMTRMLSDTVDRDVDREVQSLRNVGSQSRSCSDEIVILGNMWGSDSDS